MIDNRYVDREKYINLNSYLYKFRYTLDKNYTCE